MVTVCIGDDPCFRRGQSVLTEMRFCMQCGFEGAIAKEITPNHVLELSCPQCGLRAEVLWVDQALVGATATHDPDSDSEAW